MSAQLAAVRTRWAAVGAAVAVTVGAAGLGGYNLVNADVSSGDRPVFIPVEPCRLADTRPDPDNVGARKAPIAATETFTVRAHGENGECTGTSAIPTDAVALSLNVTALAATTQTFLTFWGGGDNPGTANLNPSPGQPPTPNAVNTPLSLAGTFNVYNDAGDVNVVIDVNGYYANHDHDDRYYTESEVDQLLSSRTLWARVNSDGTLLNGSLSDITSAYYEPNPNARWVVDFPRDVSGCAYSAVAIEDYIDRIAFTAVSGAQINNLAGHQVYVYATNQTGTDKDYDFSLTINC